MNDIPKELQSISGFIAPSIVPSEATEQPYFTIRQGNATNDFTKMKAKKGKNLTVDSITDIATIRQEGLIVTIPSRGLGGLKTSTYRLLDAITVAFTESGAKSPVVILALEEYMSKCDLKDKKEARTQAKADLEALFNARLSFKEKRRRGEPQDFTDIRICEAKGIRNGVISFSFSSVFYNILLSYPVMPYPPQLWTLNARSNPNSYYLLRKISELKNMNVGKRNEDIVSIKTLLENAPFLPSYEDVMERDRHLTQRIVDPFERDMNALSDTLTWQYCHRNNTPLTDEELANFSYTLFIELLVKLEWRAYPDQTARLKAREKAREKSQQAKKKRATSKKKRTEDTEE